VISQVTIIFIKLLLGGQAMKNFFRFTFCLVILLIISSLAFAETNKIKIGFIVKMPEQTWFQLEWRFAEEAGKEYGFDVIKIGAQDGEKFSLLSITLQHKKQKVL
jgi:ABC-type sugar transport system substrate-binding protein